MRKFDTGATRDNDEGKYDYEAFFSPLVLERRAAYMHKHRVQPDGSLRDGDNWQKGMGLSVFMKSAWRHFMEWWQLHRALPAHVPITESEYDALEEAICAIMFNAEGYLHELLKARSAGVDKFLPEYYDGG